MSNYSNPANQESIPLFLFNRAGNGEYGVIVQLSGAAGSDWTFQLGNSDTGPYCKSLWIAASGGNIFSFDQTAGFGLQTGGGATSPD